MVPQIVDNGTLLAVGGQRIAEAHRSATQELSGAGVILFVAHLADPVGRVFAQHFIPPHEIRSRMEAEDGRADLANTIKYEASPERAQ